MKAIILARVSSLDQKDNYSNPIQLDNGRDYCHRYNHDIVGEYALVESSFKDRKKFNEIIKRIEDSPEKILLVVNAVDRFQRSYRETLIVENLRQQDKIEIQFLREGLRIRKESTAMEILIWDQFVLLAKAENGIKRERVMASAQARIEKGLWNHEAPYGYRNTRDDFGKGTLKPHPIQAPLVQEIFELFRSGLYSTESLAKKINEDHQLFYSSRFTKQRISEILNRKFYYGMAKINDKEYLHKYDTLISKEDFEMCQSLLNRRKTNKQKFVGKNYIFKNLGKCGSCNWTITPDGPKKGNYYYACKNPNCEFYNNGVNEKVLLAELIEIFENLHFTDEIRAEMVSYIREQSKGSRIANQQRQAQLTVEKREIEEDLDRILELLMDRKIDDATYTKKKNMLEQRLVSIDFDFMELTNKKLEIADEVERFLTYLDRIPDIFESSNIEQKHKLLSTITSNFIQQGKKVRINLLEPFSFMLISPDRRVWLPIADALRTFNWVKFERFTYAS